MSPFWTMKENFLGELDVDAWLRPWHIAYGLAERGCRGAWIAIVPDYGLYYQRTKPVGGWGDWHRAPAGMNLDDLKAYIYALEKLRG